MTPLLLLTLLCLACRICAAVADESSAHWRLTREDVDREFAAAGVEKAKSLTHCTMLGGSSAHAVQFDEAQSLCRLFVCRGGWSGCWKCRNAENSSLPLVWVRNPPGWNHCWRTFQHRVDDSVDFNRNWSSYANGFGQGPSANYWMGLESLRLLTRDAALPVRWEFSDWNDTLYWMEHASFQIGDASTTYTVSIGSQLLDRSTVIHCPVSSSANLNGAKFSTYDRDSDTTASVNCANDYKGGWWMRGCFCWNPNGPYVNPPEALRLTTRALGLGMESAAMAYPFDQYYSMKTFECLLLQKLADG